MNRNNRQAGFSLVEMAVYMAISVVVTTAVIRVVVTATDTYNSTTSLGRIQADARRSLDSLAVELRMADRDTIVFATENGSTRIDYRLPLDYVGGRVVWSSMITVRYEPSDVDANRNDIMDEGRLVRIQDGETKVLCNYVRPSGITLTRNGDTIALNLGLMISDADGQVMWCSVETNITMRNRSVLE